MRILIEIDALMALLAANRLMNRGAVAAPSCGRQPAEQIHTATPSREAVTANEHLLSPLRGYVGVQFRVWGITPAAWC
jgi:hypothetical protein